MSRWTMWNKKPQEDMTVLENTVHPLLLKILYNRDVNTVSAINQFLHPQLSALPEPEELYGVKEAVAVLQEKYDAKAPVRIVGDYDVDGTMGTYILVKTMEQLGFVVDYRIPHRVHDGYGVSSSMVEEAASQGVDTIITVDNGIMAQEQAKLAKKLGLDLIITDHHEPLVEQDVLQLPEALVVIDPKRCDYPYAYGEICGAYVAMKLAWALWKAFGREEQVFVEMFLAMAAFATVCDMMPLVGENRVLVSFGLEYLRRTTHVGLSALMEATGVERERLGTYHLGFILGPAVNAAGRLDDATLVVDLMLEEDQAMALEMAYELRDLNRLRIDMTQAGIEEALAKIEEAPWKDDPVYVVYLPEVHESLAGIIAGKIKDAYHRPTFVITGQKELLKGSGRSIPPYHMVEKLGEAKALLERFGGHKQAAGLAVRQDRLQDLREFLVDHSGLTQEDLVPYVYLDGELPFHVLTVPLMEEVEALCPFGLGNPRPLFGRRNVLVKGATLLGKNRQVLKLLLEDEGCEMYGMIFRDADDFIDLVLKKYDKINRNMFLAGMGGDVRMDFVYELNVNEFRGTKTPQIIVMQYR